MKRLPILVAVVLIVGAQLVIAGGQAFADPAWTPRESNRSWQSVAMSADGAKQTAVASGDQIYTSTDYGATWTPRDSSRDWQSVAMSADGARQSAVAYGGQIYTSTDYGETWTPRDSIRDWRSVAMSADGAKQTAVVQGGKIYTSTDYGATWTPRDYSGWWRAVAMSADGTKQTAAVWSSGSGQIYTSADSGATWTARGISASWISVAMSADGTKQTALVFDGQIYTSTDYGATWTPRDYSGWWRAVAMSANGTRRTAVVQGGQIYTFSAIAPTVTTTTPTSITPTGASSGGNLTDDGGDPVTARGVCWSTSTNPTTANAHTTDGTGTGSFTSSLTGLDPETTYHVRAYATNDVGTSYGSDAKFTTLSNSSTWYLAEGTTAWGFSTYISIENPNDTAVDATVTYMPKGGANVSETVSLPGESQTTLTNDHLLQVMGSPMDFSTKVEATDKTKTIAVDRTMEWTGTGATSEEAHSSVGVTSPAATWYLPEGSTNWNFETWLLIQNPNGQEASCDVTYMVEGEGPRTVNHRVPANSRATFNIATDIGSKDASIKVDADVPVIPERAMYRNNRREGHDSIGTTAPANDYYLAEGTTAWGFTTYVLVQNPQNTPTDVTVTYMTPTGPVYQTPFNMPANSRKTIRVNDILPNTDISTRVHGSQPIIAERAMYWGADKPLGEACHDSIGMDAPHTTFYLPDGQTSEGRETWTLVQNPNSASVAIEVSYLTPSGAGNVVFADNIPANSRKTYNMADSGLSGRASVMVRSLTSGQKIMVERAMYWSNRGAGTDTIGGYSD